MHRSICSKALNSDKTFVSQVSQLSPTDDPTGAHPCRVVNSSIPSSLCTSWELLVFREGAGSYHRIGAAVWAESTTGGKVFVGVLGGAPVQYLCCEATPVPMAPYGMASLVFDTSRGTHEMQSANKQKIAQHLVRA